jgi:hypothetical protein
MVLRRKMSFVWKRAAVWGSVLRIRILRLRLLAYSSKIDEPVQEPVPFP